LPLLVSLSGATIAGCSDDDDADHDHEVAGKGGGGGVGKSGSGGGSTDCVTSPKTSTEILNACTDAEHIDKDSNPPRLLPDGGVPPLEGQ